MNETSIITKLEKKINQKIEAATNTLNNTAEAAFTTVATPVVNAIAEAEPISERDNKVMFFVGIFFFLLAAYINFAM